MSNFKTKSGKAKNLLGSYDLLEKRMSKSSEKTIDTTTISCQNLDHSPEDKTKIKHELQKESNSDVYEVEDCNAKKEIGSKICDYSEILSLENKCEITNELEE
jgi:hypothetical protein